MKEHFLQSWTVTISFLLTSASARGCFPQLLCPATLGSLQRCPLTAFLFFTNIPKATGPRGQPHCHIYPRSSEVLPRSALVQRPINAAVLFPRLHPQPPAPRCPHSLPNTQPTPLLGIQLLGPATSRAWKEIVSRYQEGREQKNSIKESLCFTLWERRNYLFLLLTVS